MDTVLSLDENLRMELPEIPIPASVLTLLGVCLFLAICVQPLVIVALWGYARRVDMRLRRVNEQLDTLLKGKPVDATMETPPAPMPPPVRMRRPGGGY